MALSHVLVSTKLYKAVAIWFEPFSNLSGFRLFSSVFIYLFLMQSSTGKVWKHSSFANVTSDIISTDEP